MPADGRPAVMPHAGAAKRSLLRRLAPLVVIGLVLALVLAMGWHRYLSVETLVHHRAALEGFIAAHFWLALAAFVGIYVAVVALSIPGGVFLTMAGGVLFGWLAGALAAIVAASTGATIIFLIARSAFGEAVLRRAGPLACRIGEGFRADAFSYLLFLRLVPVFPFWLVNLAPALVGVRLVPFMAATALGIIPGTFAYALVGAGLDSVIEAQEMAWRACLAAGLPDCRLDFSLSHAVTPQLIAALVALGIVALIPVAVRRYRGVPIAARSCQTADTPHV